MALRVLVVGAGGREHALAWTLARSESVGQVYVAPGNAGTSWAAAEGRAASANILINVDNIDALINISREREIDLAVIGPEAPLAAGMVDAFAAAGIRAFGPMQAAAQLEASKAFSKAFMQQHRIPTAAYGAFTDCDEACAFAAGFGKAVVVKADGLAAGKGVIVCDTAADAQTAIERVLSDHEFGAAGDRVVVEERLIGSEISAMAFCDGHTVQLMPLARDHKRIFDNDAGPNTGGMGAYAPVPDVPDALRDAIIQQVLQPTVDGMRACGTPYVGVLYAGLMLTPNGLQVLEFNCRFGDPETQVVLPLLKSDLAQVMIACVEGRLAENPPVWSAEACATVVAASPGYPGSYPRGLVISGLDDADNDAIVFHAGTVEQGGGVVTAGGRVLSVSACGESLPEALDKAYARLETIQFDGIHYRRDIGRIAERVGQ